MMKRGVVHRCDLASARKIRLQFLQLLDPQSTDDVGQAVVESEQHHFVVPLPGALALSRIAGNPMVSEPAKSLCEFGIMGRYHAAFAGGDVLHRMKAEHRLIRDAADPRSFVFRTKSVASILNHDEVVLSGRSHDGIKI